MEALALRLDTLHGDALRDDHCVAVQHDTVPFQRVPFRALADYGRGTTVARPFMSSRRSAEGMANRMPAAAMAIWITRTGTCAARGGMACRASEGASPKW